MEVSPITVFYGSMLGLAIAALFVVMFRQGRSPTYSDMREMERQTREELRAEIREVVRAATLEINAELNRQMAETNHRINETNHRINETNRRIDEMNHRIDEMNHRIDQVLTALANHEHLDGRVIVAMQPDTEPAPAASDN